MAQITPSHLPSDLSISETQFNRTAPLAGLSADGRRSRIGARRNIGSLGQHPCVARSWWQRAGYVASTIFKMFLDGRHAMHILTIVEILKAISWMKDARSPLSPRSPRKPGWRCFDYW